MSAVARNAIKWRGDAMQFAKDHVDAGVLRVDDNGCVWREAAIIHGSSRPVKSRRAENVGGKGYLRVSLWVSEERRLCQVMAHRLVYEVLVGPIPDGLEINHKDLNKQNNKPNNLEPVTGLENTRHSWRNGRVKPWSKSSSWRGKPRVTDEQKAEAIRMRRAGARIKDVAKAIGISMTHAQRITTNGCG